MQLIDWIGQWTDSVKIPQAKAKALRWSWKYIPSSLLIPTVVSKTASLRHWGRLRLQSSSPGGEFGPESSNDLRHSTKQQIWSGRCLILKLGAAALPCFVFSATLVNLVLILNTSYNVCATFFRPCSSDYCLPSLQTAQGQPATWSSGLTLLAAAFLSSRGSFTS